MDEYTLHACTLVWMNIHCMHAHLSGILPSAYLQHMLKLQHRKMLFRVLAYRATPVTLVPCVRARARAWLSPVLGSPW